MADKNLHNGGRRLFVELLMLLFNGHVKTDEGSLGKLSMQFNEDDGDETMADVIWSAMIDEGNDGDDINCERKKSEFIWDGELSAGGHQEPNAISSVHLKCRMLTVMMCDNVPS